MENPGPAQSLRKEGISLGEAVQQFLPEIGSIKVRRDPAGFEQPMHERESDEILLIVEGNISFQAHGMSCPCNPGDQLILPRGTKHSSIAGKNGCIYIIAKK